MGDAMDARMAAAHQAGELAGLDGRHYGGIDAVHGAFHEGACAVMAMQAFTVVIGIVELDGFRNGSNVLDVNVTEAAKLRENRSIHNVVGMAGVASLFARDARILEMCSRHIPRIVDIKAPAVRSITWQERQNCVCLERSICSEAPMEATRLPGAEDKRRTRIACRRVWL